jgi:hypothetical protein
VSSVRDIVTASGRVQKGKLFVRNRRAFDQQVAQLKETWELEVIVQRLRAARSMNQNRWYWSQVVGLVSQYTGSTPDDIHAIYKAKFLPRIITVPNIRTGEVVAEFTLGGSTRTMNTLEFSQYCESIREWAADTLGVIIPDPEPMEAF